MVEGTFVGDRMGEGREAERSGGVLPFSERSRQHPHERGASFRRVKPAAAHIAKLRESLRIGRADMRSKLLERMEPALSVFARPFRHVGEMAVRHQNRKIVEREHTLDLGRQELARELRHLVVLHVPREQRGRGARNKRNSSYQSFHGNAISVENDF